jgi:hypothetical protein
MRAEKPQAKRGRFRKNSNGFSAENRRFRLAAERGGNMSSDVPQLNPSALTIAQIAQVLSAVSGKPVTIAMIQSDIADGAPTNAGGTVNLVMYAAWLLKDRSRAN